MSAPAWIDLTLKSGIPFKSAWGTASFSDINNEKVIYLFGGAAADIITDEYLSVQNVYSFDVSSSTWGIPTVKGNPPNRRGEIKSVIDNTIGKMYIFGGATDSSTGSPTVQFYNDMVIFNIVELSWSVSNSPVLTRASYSATLLSNGNIVYIGGYSDINGRQFDISQLDIFDTNSLTWSSKIAKLIDPVEKRDSHSAVLAPNDMIIIYGGLSPTYSQVTPDLAVLNTKTLEWTAPLVSSDVGKVPSLGYHTADIFGNYMFVAFGNITRPNARPLPNKNSQVYILDIRNYTWVYNFEPQSTTTTNISSVTNNPPIPTSTISNSSGSNNNDQLITLKIAISAIGSILCTVFLLAVGFFGYRFYRRRQMERQNGIMRVHGNVS